MIAALLLASSSGQVTSKAVYDEIQARISGLKSIRYSYGPPVIDSGQYPSIVSFRKPNQFTISGTGHSITCDGKWYLEMGELAEIKLRKAVPADNNLYGPGLEGMLSPTRMAIPEGDASEEPLPWDARKTATKIQLGYPGLKGTMALYVDRTTKLPLGFVFPASPPIVYFEIIPDITIKDADLRVDPPPTMAELMARIKTAQPASARFEFDLRLDYKKPWERIILSKGRSSMPRRDLFGFESYLGKKSPIVFEGEPMLDKFELGTWMIKGRVPGSKKEIRVYFDWQSYVPVGYEFWMNDEPVRHAEYAHIPVQ